MRRRIWALAGLLAAAGCHWVLPFSSGAGDGPADGARDRATAETRGKDATVDRVAAEVIATCKPNSCFIGGQCYGPSEPNSVNPCEECQPAASSTAWTALADGLPCDDGDACSEPDSCQQGACRGKYLAKKGCVITIAGDGTPGPLDQPAAVALDSGATLYISDRGNHRVRKLALATGQISDAATTTGAMVSPRGLASAYDQGSSTWELYIADSGASLILKISALGDLTTVAGSTAGWLDGALLAAQFNQPRDVVPWVSSWFAVADTENHRIRKFSTMGTLPQVQAYAGTGVPGLVDGMAGSAQFSRPSGLVVAGSGASAVLYVADTGNHCIRAIDMANKVTTFAGSPTAGFVNADGTSARFDTPTDVVADSTASALYVADTNNHRIRKILTLGGTVSTAGGSGTAGFADGAVHKARFKAPEGVALGKYKEANGTVVPAIFVADTQNHRIRVILLP